MTPQQDTIQQMKDESHLRLLVIFHYLLGALELLGGIFLAVVTVLMIRMIQSIPTTGSTTPPPSTSPPPSTPSPTPGSGPPPEEVTEVMTSMMGFMYGGWAILTVVLAILTLLSAYGISKKKWEVLSLITAGVQCLFFPFGTALGVFTFIVLLRPSISAQYRQNKQVPAIQ